MRPKTIGLIAHTGKPGVAELARAVSAEFAQAAVSVLVEAKTATLAGLKSRGDIPTIASEADLLVVLGGDGTILHVVGQLDDTIKPIFGINVGSLGFLTCANSNAYLDAVQCIVRGEMTFSNRTLLEAIVNDGQQTHRPTTGLNDVVFSRGEVSRLVRLKTSVNGEPLTEFNADGLIVATPTGSTAYSLSAGGPILSPESGAFVVTPICPHVLTNRSIIVGENSVLEIEVTEQPYPVFLTVDGRDPVRLEVGAKVSVRKSGRVLPLAALPGVSFFNVVRQKLKWGGSNV
ncbi:MAG TPA: NAD(+)/NADH kinase [Chthoniobacterales bacterium]|nr:NAD(+)/NADH kinase [Chthoniobacterales bacterium]